MTKDSEIWIRPGPIRAKAAQRLRPFINQALAAAQKAGASVRNGQVRSAKSGFGRGRAATLRANRLLTNRSRQAVVKARVVRHRGQPTPLKAHLRYLQREGVTQDGSKAHLFGPEADQADAGEFAERTADDRHHFRFIVSPDDAHQMEDLKSFSRDLMKQAEQDLGTKLDWVGVAHWNTEHPHVHIVVRGKTDQGEDLVISRDYIKEGMRARAQNLITLELGERTDQDIRQSLHRQVDSERLTQLDRQMLSDQRRAGYIDLAPATGASPDEFQVLKAGRMRKLEALGLANQFAPAQWVISEQAPAILRELGERSDIIKRIHRGLAESGIERAAASYVVSVAPSAGPVVGKLVDRGLDDELKGTAFVIVDGVDGRTHHVSLPDLEATSDATPGAIVEVKRTTDNAGTSRLRLSVLSDHPLEAQIGAPGATWLDKVAVTGQDDGISDGGFGGEAQAALARRGDHLVSKGLAKIGPEGLSFRKDLLSTLRQRELEAVAGQIAKTTGRSFVENKAGEYASGTYSRRLNLSSGRFAVLDDVMGFRLVPWSPSIETRLGQHISGVVRDTGSISWSFGRKRDLGL